MLLVLPLYALDIDASFAGIGSLLALRSAGTLLVDVPAGIAIARFGEKKLIVASIATMALSCVGFIFAVNWFAMALFILLFGMGLGGWTLTRHSFVGGKTLNRKRGRRMSKLVTLQRGGMFAGPLLGGLVGEYFGYTAAFLLAGVLCFTALLLCLLHLPKISQKDQQKSLKMLFSALPILLQQHKKVFMTAAVFVMILRFVRGARQLILPLWGIHIGLNAVDIGLLMATTALIEVPVIYIGGHISDKRGRKWAAVPSLALLSLSLLLLPYCQTFELLCWFALITGIANGLGGGIIMTLGADLAPKEHRSTFLGVWRLMADFSGTISPVLIGSIAAILALSDASIFSGGIGLLGSLLMVFWVKETLANRNLPDQEQNQNR